MGTSFKARLAQFSPERQARVKAGADRLEAEIVAYPVAPRLSPSGTYYICDQCERSWMPGNDPGCPECAAAWTRAEQGTERLREERGCQSQ